MDYQTARTFLAAAECGSFANAARRVHASPSTVTERIAQLEARLGNRLFIRDKRGCELTTAGERFVPSALAMVRAWDQGKEQAGLPSEFNASLSIGGQYSLWPLFLTDWLPIFRDQFPDIAVRAEIGVSSRLNREVIDGTMDIALLYDPILRNDVVVERLLDDRLIMVTADAHRDWRENYVRVKWGVGISSAIAAQLGIEPNPGLTLDLGVQAASFLQNHKATGYMPSRLVRTALDAGTLHPVANVPDFEYPAFVIWRRSQEENETLNAARASIREAANSIAVTF